MNSTKKKILLYIVIGLVVVIVAGSMIAMSMNHEEPLSVDELLSLGEKYLLDLEYEQALVQFLKVIEIEPMNERAYLGAAEAYIELGQTDKAIEILERGLQATGDAEIQAMLDELTPRSEPEHELEAETYGNEDDDENSELGRLFQQAAQNSTLFDFNSVALYGHSIEGMDIFTLQSALASNGFNITFYDGIESYADEPHDHYWFSAEKESIGPSIDVLQYHYSTYADLIIFHHSLSVNDKMPLQTFISDIYTRDSIETVLRKLGFSNDEDISAEIRMIAEEKYLSHEEIFDALSFDKTAFFSNGWYTNGGGTSTTQLESGEHVLADIDIYFRHKESNVMFTFEFSADIPNEGDYIFNDLYLTRVSIHQNL